MCALLILNYTYIIRVYTVYVIEIISDQYYNLFFYLTKKKFSRWGARNTDFNSSI